MQPQTPWRLPAQDAARCPLSRPSSEQSSLDSPLSVRSRAILTAAVRFGQRRTVECVLPPPFTGGPETSARHALLIENRACAECTCSMHYNQTRHSGTVLDRTTTHVGCLRCSATDAESCIPGTLSRCCSDVALVRIAATVVKRCTQLQPLCGPRCVAYARQLQRPLSVATGRR